MNKICKWCLFVVLIMVALFGTRGEVVAKDVTKNVNITVPTHVNIIFDEDGTNEVSDFVIENASLVPITINTIHLTECNDWKVVAKGTTIPADTKQFVFQLEEQCLSAGENGVCIPISASTTKQLKFEIERGAWTHSDSLQSALHMEMQYSFDMNDSVAYAIYLKEDTSLRFIRSVNEIRVGDVYDGKTVDAVYTGFEDAVYHSDSEIPWYDGNYYIDRIVTKVVVEDEIKPKSTAHWFRWMYDCKSFDLVKLDTSRVTDMSYMFAWAGFFAETFEMKGADDFDVSNVKNMEYTFAYTARDSESFVVDLSDWDVSKVTTMYYMFAGTGYFNKTFQLGDLSKWDVSNVTIMASMFRQTGYEPDWFLDCSGWDVRKVTYYTRFNLEVSSKVIAPKWVH